MDKVVVVSYVGTPVCSSVSHGASKLVVDGDMFNLVFKLAVWWRPVIFVYIFDRKLVAWWASGSLNPLAWDANPTNPGLGHHCNYNKVLFFLVFKMFLTCMDETFKFKGAFLFEVLPVFFINKNIFSSYWNDTNSFGHQKFVLRRPN